MPDGGRHLRRHRPRSVCHAAAGVFALRVCRVLLLVGRRKHVDHRHGGVVPGQPLVGGQRLDDTPVTGHD